MGPYRAKVISNSDPEKRGRVKCAIPDLFLDPYTNEIVPSPWIESSSPSSDLQGFLNVPSVGEQVWVFVVDSTEEGECWELMYSGGPGCGSPTESQIPEVARGEDDETCTDYKVQQNYRLPSADMRIISSDDNDNKFIDTIENPQGDARGDIIRTSELVTPSSYNDGEYPHNRVFKTPGGLCIEIDDTPGAERLHIWHPSGTYWELGKSGQLVERATNKFCEAANHSSLIKGTKREFIDDTHYVTIRRNELKEVKGRKCTLASSIGMEAATQVLLRSRGEMSIISDGPATQEHVGGRVLNIGGPDIIKRFSKSETVLSQAEAAYNSSLAISFTGAFAFETALAIPASALGDGACAGINIGQLYSTIKSSGPSRGCHFSIGDPIASVAQAAGAIAPATTLTAAAALLTEGTIIKGKNNICFTSPVTPLLAESLLKYQPFVELIGVLQTFVAADIAAVSTALGGASAGLAVTTAPATSAIFGPLNPAFAGLTTGLTAQGAALTALEVALTGLLTKVSTPATAGYTISLRSS